ncbi:hypothetical protein [uncultured Chryseobacterium sp.]|uniref:hypothetical protein n=1 Tax=uncultured Chryseobacterium sp. TaxID=259322 RepID=UPI0025DB26FF|nr:hypothetical protein [uncultured Chryseobacterium sp.]
MERLSNSVEAVIHEAEIEIGNFDLKDGEKTIVYLSELPSISGFPYKIIVVQNSEGTICSRFRQWDTAYNFKQWTSGIYNLDRLRIITAEKVLSETDTTILEEELLKLENIKLPESIENKKAMVLDGSEWKFGIRLANKNIEYTWRTATEEIDHFIPIIELIRKLYSDKIQ